MDRATVDVYEREATRYRSRRKAFQPELAAAFSTRVRAGKLRVDLGCGPGLYLDRLGTPVVGVDAALGMLRLAREREPFVPVVQADLEALPFRPSAFGGGWASKSLQHIPRTRLPMALAQMHRILSTDAPFTLTALVGTVEELSTDDFPGRLLTLWEPDALADIVTGAGFAVEAVWTDRQLLNLTARRTPAAPDTIGEAMRLLVCMTEHGGRSRFWAAARRAGLATRDADPFAAWRSRGMGIVHLRDDAHRVERLAAWLEPDAVCVVGLTAWRAVAGHGTRVGPQADRIGGRPTYVMPSTAGRATVDELASHLQAAVALGETG